MLLTNDESTDQTLSANNRTEILHVTDFKKVKKTGTSAGGGGVFNPSVGKLLGLTSLQKIYILLECWFKLKQRVHTPTDGGRGPSLRELRAPPGLKVRAAD